MHIRKIFHKLFKFNQNISIICVRLIWIVTVMNMNINMIIIRLFILPYVCSILNATNNKNGGIGG